jgi:predicted RNA-binding Zn-ribbon protein involved in translation (DUF1610 family)
MKNSNHTVVECVDCDATFTDVEVEAHFNAGGKTCPKCGTEKKPRLIGAAATARLLADEYLSVKPYLAGRASPPMTPEDMTTRQQVGLWLVNSGRARALADFDALPRKARRGYEKKWPGFRALLERVCDPGSTE